MGSQVNLKALGLNYSPNNLALPEGSLLVANDVIVRRDNVVESRRGFKEYSQNFGDETSRSSQLLTYKNRILNHYYAPLTGQGVLSYDTGVLDSEGKAIFSNFSGDFKETETGLRIKSIQSNKNLYFTTSEGIKKLAALSAATLGSSKIVDAGAVKAINFTAELDIQQGQSTGFLGFDSCVAYRVLWGYKDVNENLILGSPSDSVSVYNYLSDVCSLDMNALCVLLDNLVQNSSSYYSVIHNRTTNAASETFTGTFSSEFKSQLTDSADTLKTNLIGIATNIDRFSLLADINEISPTEFNKPLTISTFQVLNKEGIVTFLPNIVSNFSISGTLNNPSQMAFDTSGNLFVCDSGNNEIKKITPDGTTTTFYSTALNNPQGIAIDINNNVFIANTGANTVLKVDSTATLISTYIGFSSPNGLVTNTAGIVFVCDTNNHLIKQISTSGVITTIAGSIAGDADNATGTSAKFQNPKGICIDSSGNLFVSDTGNNKIRKIEANATFSVTVFAGPAAGTTTSGLVNGVGTAARFTTPIGICIDSQNTLYVVDNGNAIAPFNYAIRKIDTTSSVTTIAGSSLSGSTNGIGSAAKFNYPVGIAIDTTGNLFVSETGNDDIRKLTSSNPLDVFSVGDKIEILGANSPFDVMNNIDETGKKYHQITSLTSNSLKFTLDNTNISAQTPSSNTSIYSYNYRDIINTTQTDVTDLTNAQAISSLVNLDTNYPSNKVYSCIESNIFSITNRLKTELSLFISENLQNLFVSNFNITTATNVKLTINIPEAIKTNIENNGLDYFFQVYRTQNVIATGETVLGQDITPDEEMRLVYEAFPTAQELDPLNLQIVFIDTYPDDLRGFNSNLYTNPASGEGLSQANEPPPIAKDINVFKDYVFYANTKTKHRLNPINLLGTSNIQDGDKIIISDGTTIGTTEYTFTLGKKEQTTFTFTSSPFNITDFANKSFSIYSANDLKKYFIWYRLDNKNINSVLISGTTATFTTTNPHNLIDGDKIQILNTTVPTGIPSANGIYVVSNAGTVGVSTTFDIEIDPLITSIDISIASFIPYFVDQYVKIVDLLTAVDTSVQLIVNKSINVINSLPYDFFAENGLTTNSFIVINVDEGVTSDAQNNTFGAILSLSIVQGAGQDFSTNKVLLSQAESRAQAIDLTARSLVSVINKNEDSPIVAYYLSSPTTLPGIMSFESETLQDQTFYIMGSTAGVGTSFNPDISPINEIKYKTYTFTVSSANATSGAIYKDSANNQFLVQTTITGGTTLITKGAIDPSTLTGLLTKVSGVGDNTISYSSYSFSSLISVINGTVGSNIFTLTSISHGLNNNHKIIICNSNSNPIIDGIYSVSNCTANTFDITFNSNFISSGNTFSYSKLSDTVGSTNETKPNRIYYSKLLRPEAVPSSNAIDIGSEDKKILRIFPLRDSLFVFKEDGLFRISGEVEPFVRTLFDSSCVLIAPDSVGVANNIIYGWTNKGISNITESGVNEISRPIDTVILKLASASYPNFSKLTWGFGYDSDNSYTVYTNSTPEDEYATVAFRFSNLTNTWTNFKRSQTCGLIKLDDDKIYSGSGIYDLIDQERKSFDRTDYSDRDFSINVLNGKIINNGKTIIPVDLKETEIGDVIVQEQILTIYLYNALLQKLDIDPPLKDDYESLLKIQTNGVNLLDKVQALATKLGLDPALSSINYSSAIIGITDATEAFNIIINLLNNPTSGTTFKNYKQATETVIFESVVENVNKTNKQITVNLALQYVVGKMQVYKAIPCELQYAPVTFGDPLSLKQIYEATMMFNNKAFTKAKAEFSSDLKPEFFPVEFYGQGNGIFGHYSEPGFGFGFFGGGSNAAPFRTIIPRETQRCRFINVRFSHKTARELWNLYGITLTGNAMPSTRAYR